MVGKRMPWYQHPWGKVLLALAVLLLGYLLGRGLWLGLQAWQSRTPPSSVGVFTNTQGWTLDEQARLLLAFEAMLDLEKRQAYADIYDLHGDQSLKEAVARKTFLATVSCVEQHLGPLEGYLRTSVKTQRLAPDAQGRWRAEITAQVNRRTNLVWQRYVIVFDDLDFWVAGVYTSATEPAFKDCLATATTQSKPLGLTHSHPLP
jgi:hypothetical protein